jgi:hypothetical protein
VADRAREGHVERSPLPKLETWALDSASMDSRIVETHCLHALREKARLLLRCLDEIEANGRTQNLQGDGRESAARPDVEDAECASLG